MTILFGHPTDNLNSHHAALAHFESVRNRLRQHNEGKVPATRRRTPLTLVYYEACLSVEDGFRREKYLKSAYGKRYLKSRLRHYFTGPVS